MKAWIISVVAALLTSCGQAQLPITATGGLPQSFAPVAIPQWQAQHLAHAACPQIVGQPTCLALRVLKGGVPLACSGPSTCGWTAPQLEAAYNLSDKLGNGSGTNIALIEVGDLPHAVSDFATYRKAFGLGAGHLTKYNQDGEQSHYPPSCEEYSWCGESDLDEDMVAAACPKCNVLMIEAKGPPNFYGDIGSLEQAEAEAVKIGATVLSNSWICYGVTHSDCGDSNFPKYFDTPGITYLAGSGDDGYGVIGPPSALASVIAVGGTQLAERDSKYSETWWGDAGSGCASPKEVGGSGIPKPSWQKDPDCSYRTDADVSAESGCQPGIAVYTSIYGGWSEWCGTSVATPFTAGVTALAGNAAQLDAGKTFWKFSSANHAEYFNHPTGRGTVCRNYLCGRGRYEKYYSGPGGWGSPNGIAGY
jgi:subtilase family serine protease